MVTDPACRLLDIPCWPITLKHISDDLRRCHDILAS